MRPARLSFFNEQDPPALTALVADPQALATLRALGARVTMGLRDLSDERAEAVRRLQRAGVAVDGWLLLPRAQGYFATHDNVEAVEARVEEVLAWRARHHLPLEALGFDFEPDLRELEVFFHARTRALATWLPRAFDRVRRERALERYRALAGRVRAQGLALESYQFPLLLEDRGAGSHFFQRLAGALDLPVEREVAMAYTSLLGPFGPGLLAQWATRGTAIAVGSTGGGIDPLPKLSWEELARDLRLAARACRDVSVFSLEGCVAQGWLERLVDFDWGAPVELPRSQRLGATALRSTARGLAWLLR